MTAITLDNTLNINVRNRFLRIAALLALTLLAANNLWAIAPTPAQIAQFKSLSPADQKKLANQFGVSIPTGMSGAGATTKLATPTTVTPRSTTTAKPDEASITKFAKPTTESADLTEDTQERVVKKTLIQYGYDLFAGTPSTFAPVTDIPVPLDYVVGPGDTVLIQLYGKESSINEITIDRQGILQFPNIGPIAINGLNFTELRGRIHEIVSEQMIGVKASVTMGALRSIRVFVLGEAYRPGSYTVSSLSTITNALFVSGGITKIGSLRHIQLKRRGKVISELDLYDLLLRGDTSADARLQPGDVLFIPPIGKTVGVTGEVRRPAIYELKDENTMGELMGLAGGLLPTAFPKVSRVDRISKSGDRTFVDVDLTKIKGKALKVLDGDVLQIYSILDKLEGAVLLSGHVHRPGGFSWTPGMRFSDVVGDYDELLPNPDRTFALIHRKTGPSRLTKVLRVNLVKALGNKGSDDDLKLQSRDEVQIFGMAQNHASAVASVVNRLKTEVAIGEYPAIATLSGHVKFPGAYPIYEGMTVAGLIESAAGYLPEVDRDYALLVKLDESSGAATVQELNLISDQDLSITLKPRDQVLVFGVNSPRNALLAPVIQKLKIANGKDTMPQYVGVGGQVRFPGEYPLIENMTLTMLIESAGGFLDSAYTASLDLTRTNLDTKNQFELEHLTISLGEKKSAKAFLLKPQDQFLVKKITHWGRAVTVELLGEVKFPGAYIISAGETMGQVVSRAGGLTEEADPKGAVFLRASLKAKEQKIMSRFSRQMEADLALLEKKAVLLDDEVSAAKAAGASLLNELKSAEAIGRLVIDLPAIISGEEDRDVVLKQGDRLVIPTTQQEVSVLGEVQFPTSHLYNSRLNGKDYISFSGGYTRNADDGRTYVIKRDGQVRPLKRRWLFVFSRTDKVQPGDAVVVPMDIDTVGPLVYWGQISKILFQLASSGAALKTIGAL